MLCKVFWSICSNFFKFDFDQDLWLRILFWFLQARIRFIFDQKATIISIRQCPIELIRKLYCMQWYRFFFSTDPPRNRRNFFAYIRTQKRRIRLKFNYFFVSWIPKWHSKCSNYKFVYPRAPRSVPSLWTLCPVEMEWVPFSSKMMISSEINILRSEKTSNL